MARKHFLKPLKDLWIYNNSIGKSFNREKLFELGKKNIVFFRFRYNTLFDTKSVRSCQLSPQYSNEPSIKQLRILVHDRSKPINKQKYTDERNQSKYKNTLSLLFSIFLLYVFINLNLDNLIVLAEKSNSVVDNDSKRKIKDKGFIPGLPIDGLPVYTGKEVAEHQDPDKSVWIIFKAGVYDVTDFIQIHPGGRELLLGAGNSVEPFWKVYSQHHNQQVYRILESYRIGNLREEDRLKEDRTQDEMASLEFIPERDPLLLVHHEKPFNAETPANLLIQNYHTPNNIFFVRNHLSVPKVEEEDYSLEIEGIGLDRTYEFTLEEIKTLFPKHTVTSVIQCGGNRRNDLNKVEMVKGISWQLGAIGNTRWTGARLVDVLRYCNADLEHPEIKHVQFEGLDLDAKSEPYGASVSSVKAFDPLAEFLLAYEMNGEELPADHGYPIRLIAPGIVGARNVKWLAKIILADHESQSHWQQNDYKSFPSNKKQASPEEFAQAHAIQEMPIQSAICLPEDDQIVQIKWKRIDDQTKPFLDVAGYAWSGGGRSVIRVDVSIDGGKTWFDTELEQETPTKRSTTTFSWTLWKSEIPLDFNQLRNTGNQIEVICRAIDSSYNMQPARNEEIWNFRGLLNNSWHRINIKVV
ncbi:hypothetical protein NH340_JMT08064 [Sarcoptes scabiei]|nr:hypothetical protein NH340_JMT08064 [Sarcoptes scabiei]